MKNDILKKKWYGVIIAVVVALIAGCSTPLQATPQLIPSPPGPLVSDLCDIIIDGTYCDGNALITCIAGDPVTNVDVTCVDVCVDNGDGNAYCEMQQSLTEEVISLNQFCQSQADGFYCVGALAGNPSEILVYCSNSAAGLYWYCSDANACAAAEAVQDPSSC